MTTNSIEPALTPTPSQTRDAHDEMSTGIPSSFTTPFSIWKRRALNSCCRQQSNNDDDADDCLIKLGCRPGAGEGDGEGEGGGAEGQKIDASARKSQRVETKKHRCD